MPQTKSVPHAPDPTDRCPLSEVSSVSPGLAAANPAAKIVADLSYQRAARRRGSYPPGPTGIGPSITFLRDPLAVLLPAYERYGPVFTMRTLHALSIWVLGAEGQHQLLVSQGDAFSWRHGGYRELLPLLGDGLITTDGDYHDRSRRLVMPVFHSDRLGPATRTMISEADRALVKLVDGEHFDPYVWVREVTMRVAMRSLFGLDPDRSGAERVASDFERGISFYGHELWVWLLRGPRTPYSGLRTARQRVAKVVQAEIERRRGQQDLGSDILSLLIAAEDESGWRLSDAQLLDHCLTLLFAGHDTTTTAVSLALHELAASPEWLARVTAELDSELGDEPASVEQLFSGLPLLEQVIDETVRLYPPVPAGLRRASEDVTIAGVEIPAGASVNYSSWATQRLPEYFPDPDEFRPERMTREAKALLPKGAYVPFGGGKRVCIGKRFGYLEAKVILSRLLQRYTLEPKPDHDIQVKWAATLVPQDLSLAVRAR